MLSEPMPASIALLTAIKTSLSQAISSLDKQEYLITCYSGSERINDFLSQSLSSFDLFIVDVDLHRDDLSRVIKEIRGSDLKNAAPILFVTDSLNKGTSKEYMSPYLKELKPGRYDFIDTDCDPVILNARVSVLLEVGRLQENLDSAVSEIRYLGGLGHDLRNPVHGILSYAGFGLKKGAKGQLTEEKTRHYFQSIKDAGTRLLDLLENIVFLAKLDAGSIPFEKSERNLWTVTQGVLSEMSRQLTATEIALNCIEPDSPALGCFDHKQTGGVIRRLLNTCMQTAEDNTQLTLTVSSLAPAAEDNRLHVPAVGLTLQHPDADFSDQRLEDLTYLFNNGGHEKGTKGQTGLSFAICQRIVARHNGCIWVEKHSTGGVVFGFQLPVDTC